MFVGLGAFVVNEFSHGPVDLWIVMWQWIGMFLPKPVAEYPSAMINRLWSVFGDSLLRSNPETRQKASRRALWGPFGPSRPGSQPEWPK
jgi:hypothetical protein